MTTTMDIARPLSWGISSMLRGTQYDSEALLTACSQKLAAWQENENRIKAPASTPLKGSPQKHVQSSLQQVKLPPKDSSSSVTSRTIKNQPSEPRKSPPVAIVLEAGSPSAAGLAAKVKKKTKTTLSKIVETADMISHFTKTTRHLNARKASTAGAGLVSAVSLAAATSGGTSKSATVERQTSNAAATTTAAAPTHSRGTALKFKTTGFVATAVQHKSHKKQETAVSKSGKKQKHHRRRDLAKSAK